MSNNTAKSDEQNNLPWPSALSTERPSIFEDSVWAAVPANTAIAGSYGLLKRTNHNSAALTATEPIGTAKPSFREACPILVTVAILIVAYHILRGVNASRQKPISFLAVFSAVALNPEFLYLIARFTPLPVVAHGDSEMRSFLAGLIAFFTGVAAVVRTRKWNGQRSGMPYALIGTIGGALIVAAWTCFAILFVIGMSGF